MKIDKSFKTLKFLSNSRGFWRPMASHFSEWKKHFQPCDINNSHYILVGGSAAMKRSRHLIYNNKNTEWGILFNQNPRRNHQAEALSPKDECGFYFYLVISWIYIFMGSYSCFHIAIYLRFFTSNLLCFNVHLNCLSQDNHLVSKQPQ